MQSVTVVLDVPKEWSENSKTLTLLYMLKFFIVINENHVKIDF